MRLAELTMSVQRRLARGIDTIPAATATRIGGGPRVVDGQVLDPHLGLILRFDERFRPDPIVPDVPAKRTAIRSSSALAAGAPIGVGTVRDLTVDGADGPLRARHFSPSDGGAGRPLVVFFHGGGWVVGDLDTHDQPCRLLTRHADVHVLSVDYRLAPEHPFPAAVEDAVAAFAWGVEHAGELGADPTRVAVAGDSAGGNLAAVVAQATRDAGTTPPSAQLLLYPAVDSSVDRPSKDLFAEGYLLTRRQTDWYRDTYADGVARTDPRLSPLRAADLSGLAPAVVATAGFDPLRDEGEAYAEALRAAGVPVVLRRADGLVHGFFSMTGIHRVSREESIAVAGAFGALLDTVA